MPGYETHNQIGKICAGTFALSTFIILKSSQRIAPIVFANNVFPLPTALVLSGGIWFGGTLGSPDLDIPSSPYNHWGTARYLWLPYQILVKHRSPLSHWPVVGTILRTGYLFVMFAVLPISIIVVGNALLFALNLQFHVNIKRVLLALVKTIHSLVSTRLFWLFIVGDVIGGMVHDITDYLDGRRRVHYHGHPVPPLSEGSTETPTVWSR